LIGDPDPLEGDFVRDRQFAATRPDRDLGSSAPSPQQCGHEQYEDHPTAGGLIRNPGRPSTRGELIGINTAFVGATTPIPALVSPSHQHGAQRG
jgi:hypothetical protein